MNGTTFRSVPESAAQNLFRRWKPERRWPKFGRRIVLIFVNADTPIVCTLGCFLKLVEPQKNMGSNTKIAKMVELWMIWGTPIVGNPHLSRFHRFFSGFPSTTITNKARTFLTTHHPTHDRHQPCLNWWGGQPLLPLQPFPCANDPALPDPRDWNPTNTALRSCIPVKWLVKC